MMIKKYLLKIIFVLAVVNLNIFAQDIKINKIEPPNWWAGMKLNKIQLMVYGENLKDVKVGFNKSGIKVLSVENAESNKYAFINIEVSSNTKPDDYILTLTKNDQKAEVKFPILKRNYTPKGFNTEDVLYLIMPDRFSNGNPSNDTLPGFSEGVNRNEPNSRHGGDIRGIINHLDYIKNLGITTLWLTPVVENNTWLSYHGYQATDFYNVDKRLGDNQLYVKLVDETHKRGMKIILDHVSNHFSIDHVWIKDLPFKDWTNGTVKNHLPASHQKMVYSDVHGDSSSMMNVVNGWFADYMPDLNEQNPYVQKYIIQNTIWWMEYAKLDGIREDTYPYNYPKFMADWAKAVMEEYPASNIVGEVWTGDVAFLSTYQKNSPYPNDFETNLPALTDFGFRDAIYDYVSGKGSLRSVYELLTKDFVYAISTNMVTFVDNHDIGRLMFYAKENIKKYKNSLLMLLTTRGIPQIFYGTELGVIGTEHHGILRQDFPGGWPEDKRDAFTDEGRNDKEKDLYNYLSKLLSIRKEHKSLSNGKLIHFAPEKNTYVYFRELKNEKILCVVNDNDDKTEIDLTNYIEQFGRSRKLKNLFSGDEIIIDKNNKLQLNNNSTNLFLIH